MRSNRPQVHTLERGNAMTDNDSIAAVKSAAVAYETPLMREIMLAASAAGHRLWRNNVGVLQDARGQWIRFGLATGSSDLIGIQRNSGKFLSIEVKPGPRSRWRPEQVAWLNLIDGMGGIAAVATTIEEAMRAIGG